MLEQLFLCYRQDLFKLAYRMLGSVTEAEDVVQEIFLTLQQQGERDDIFDWKAFLMKMTTNRCLNILRSSRVLKLSYTGTWLPEPIYEKSNLPHEVTERKEEMSYALLVLMERLTPAERAVYVLRVAFDLPYPQIAELLDKTEVSCRKMYSRGNTKIQDSRNTAEAEAPLKLYSHIVEAFVGSVHAGNYQSLVGLLMDDMTLWSDGGGVVRSALNPIYGKARSIAFLEGVTRRGVALQGEMRQMILNGEPALVLYLDGAPSLALCFDCDPIAGKLRNLFWIRNPYKLSHLPKLSDVDVTN